MFDTRVPVYGIMILLALATNIIVVMLIYKKYEFSKNEIIGALVYENIGIILGAQIFTFFANYQLYEEFDLLSLGLSAYGAVIGAIICLMLFALQFKRSVKDMLFIFMPSIPLMYAIGKIGCFLAGCCVGIEYDGWGSIVYNYSAAALAGVRLFPVQLAETIVFIFIFIYIFAESVKNKLNLKTLGLSFILCGFGKFILDYLRMSHSGELLSFSLNQTVSIIFIVIGIKLFIVKQPESHPVCRK